MTPGTVFYVNKSLLDYYCEMNDMDVYTPDLKKFVWPEILPVHPITQKITYVKKDDEYYYFEYDGLMMRYGRRFPAFLRLALMKNSYIRMSEYETYVNLSTGAHLKAYQDAFNKAVAQREENRRLEEINAKVLEKYVTPEAFIDPKMPVSYYVKRWIFNMKMKIKEMIWKMHQWLQHLKP